MAFDKQKRKYGRWYFCTVFEGITTHVAKKLNCLSFLSKATLKIFYDKVNGHCSSKSLFLVNCSLGFSRINEDFSVIIIRGIIWVAKRFQMKRMNLIFNILFLAFQSPHKYNLSYLIFWSSKHSNEFRKRKRFQLIIIIFSAITTT